MASISRNKSRSVSSVPLTRTTGLSLTYILGLGTGLAGGVEFASITAFIGVGAWEATWAKAGEIASPANPRTAKPIICNLQLVVFIASHFWGSRPSRRPSGVEQFD